MRINLTFNDTNERDKTIIDFLNTRYSASAYIKELLYQVSKGNNIPINNNPAINNKTTEKSKEEYEELENLNDIDL